jgi:tetratricopeptide (TPR) repeat protein
MPSKAPHYLLFIASFILLFTYTPLGILGFIIFAFYFYALSKKPISKAVSFFEKGKVAYNRGDYKSALDNFLKVIGIIYIHLGEDEKANECFEKYLFKYPEDLEAKTRYINLLIKVGQYQKALELMNSLPEEYKNSLHVINAMADCYIELNKPDMALAVLEKGPMRKRKTVGTVYMKLGQKEKALKQFQKIYVEDSNFLDVAEILNEMEG